MKIKKQIKQMQIIQYNYIIQ